MRKLFWHTRFQFQKGVWFPGPTICAPTEKEAKNQVRRLKQALALADKPFTADSIEPQ